MRCKKHQAAISNFQKSHPGMSIPNTPQKSGFGNVGKDNKDNNGNSYLHDENESNYYACEFATLTRSAMDKPRTKP